MSLAWLIETSGFAQLLLAVLLGWPIFLHRGSPRLQGVFKRRDRLLQSHIDDIFMGLLQIVLAAHVARGGPLLAGLFLFGSWVNAQIFMLLSLTGDTCAQRGWFRLVTIFSFVSLTLAYIWLFALQFHGLE
jgi:hypothetical protein